MSLGGRAVLCFDCVPEELILEEHGQQCGEWRGCVGTFKEVGSGGRLLGS